MKAQLRVAVACVEACVAVAAGAQQPRPLDAVPEKMPNDRRYGTPISLERAQPGIAAAVGGSKRRDGKLNVAVVDSGGRLVAFARMDGAQLGSIAISEHKARAAAMYRRETKAFETGVQAGNHYLLTLDDVIASRGGIPILDGGRLIGAIGCSGATGSQDEVVCRAGADAVKR